METTDTATETAFFFAVSVAVSVFLQSVRGKQLERYFPAAFSTAASTRSRFPLQIFEISASV